MPVTLEELIRTIPNFPKEGINFRDITTLLENRWGFKLVIDQFLDEYSYSEIDKIVAIEARGFFLGGALAHALGAGLVLARKPGKLPGATVSKRYALEYGEDEIHIHEGAISPGERCLVVDDLLATGGTALATTDLVEIMNGKVVACAFIVALTGLDGPGRVGGRYPSTWLVEYPDVEENQSTYSGNE
jgi:adenine phosphoribosyltransferase